MSKKELISTNQFVWMLFSIITSFTTLQIPGLLIFHAKRDAWIAVILAWCLDVLLAIVYAYMGVRFPGENFVQYSISILGKYVGKILGLMFPLFFLMVASLLTRSVSILISNTILTKTPTAIIFASSYIFIAYGAKKGVETVGRVSEILGPIYLISFIALFIFVSPEVKLDRIRPIFNESIYTIFSGGIFILTFIGICIMMGMYIPVCNRIRNGFLAKFIAVSIGASVISLLVIFSTCIFGVQNTSNMVNPGVNLARMISFGNSIDRIEVIWFVIAISAALMTGVSLIWASSLEISQIIGMSDYKPLVYPLSLIAAILGIISFDNNTEVFNFIIYVYPFIGIFVETGLELFLFVMALVLKKRGTRTSEI
ncbi:GerAB/ArcD/ProY family transporter [Clostridium felsineum]|uniref:GerAB/ArcD/ProY family transporter n=1 Tax=Clostridium felsineum TaxID=36839 RepID=UPI00098BF626|nr:endospore germination permease [Clostridium felsineum]URZ18477.1 Spore germination protein YndE [Clostridium felsineum DSM 794]